MKQKVTPKTLSGFMELLPAEQLVFDKMKNVIEDTYRSFGFVGLDTPVLELSEVFTNGASGPIICAISSRTAGMDLPSCRQRWQNGVCVMTRAFIPERWVERCLSAIFTMSF